MRPPYALTTLVAAALACAALGAHAEGADVITISASAAVVQDSNLFRLPSDANLPALIGNSSASDQITINSVGLQFNKNYSLQRLELDLSLANYHYKNFGFLNSTSNNYSAAWRWSLSPRVRGNLTNDRKESLNDFVDVRGYQQSNQRVNVTSRLDGSYELDGAWRLLAGAAESSQTNPQNQSADADTLTRSADAGVRYVYASGSQWTYTLRTAKGNYRNGPSQAAALIDENFDQMDNELALRWVIDGKASANVRVTALNRSHPRFSQRDFSGANVAADLLYNLTGKTTVNVGLSRSLGSYQTSISNYSQTDRLSIAPTWQISARTLLRLSYAASQRDYLGAPTALAASVQQRSEKLTDTSLSFDWQPQPHLTLSAAVQDARRSANLVGLDYQSTTTSLSAQISF